MVGAKILEVLFKKAKPVSYENVDIYDAEKEDHTRTLIGLGIATLSIGALAFVIYKSQ